MAQELAQMESHPLTAIEQLLDDLANGGLGMIRREAAEKLGRLPESDERIVCALLVAKLTDSRPEVRDAATRSLAAPVHCAILEQHPDMTAQATVIASERTQMDRQQVMREFSRRRKRQMTMALFALAGSVAAWLLLMIGAITRLSGLMGLAVIVYLGGMVALIRFVWIEWRCPACDASLLGLRIPGTVFGGPSPLFCPYCGARLH